MLTQDCMKWRRRVYWDVTSTFIWWVLMICNINIFDPVSDLVEIKVFTKLGAFVS